MRVAKSRFLKPESLIASFVILGTFLFLYINGIKRSDEFLNNSTEYPVPKLITNYTLVKGRPINDNDPGFYQGVAFFPLILLGGLFTGALYRLVRYRTKPTFFSFIEELDKLGFLLPAAPVTAQAQQTAPSPRKNGEAAEPVDLAAEDVDPGVHSPVGAGDAVELRDVTVDAGGGLEVQKEGGEGSVSGGSSAKSSRRSSGQDGSASVEEGVEVVPQPREEKESDSHLPAKDIEKGEPSDDNVADSIESFYELVESKQTAVAMVRKQRFMQQSYVLLIIFGMLFMVAGHMLQGLFYFAFIGVNYAIVYFGVKISGPRAKWITPTIWVYNIALSLLRAPWNDAYNHDNWISNLQTGFIPANMVPQLIIMFSVPRNISWTADYLERLRGSFNVGWLQKQRNEHRLRTSIPLPLKYYRFDYFVMYQIYNPCYLAGPIVTFNSFYSQLVLPMPPPPVLGTAIYLLRVAFWFMFIWLYDSYVYQAGLIPSGAWKDDFPVLPPWEYFFTMLSAGIQKFIHLLILWRLSRAWSLANGIWVPENFSRCAFNNSTFANFWKTWHASVNKFTARYMYIPLGGSRNRNKIILPIFLFIGIWHFPETRYVQWALSNAVCLVIEAIVIAQIKRSKWWRGLKSAAVRKRLTSLGIGIDFVFIMIANMTILTRSPEYVFILVYRTFLKWTVGGGSFRWINGPVCLLGVVLFYGNLGRIQLEIREAEQRRGIDKPY